jgi:AraC-type transcriptional regulator N-terminus
MSGLMHSKGSYPPAPVVYEPSIVIIAQGYKRARVGDSTLVYDARNYLVLSVPLPFECEIVGTSKNPMLGLAVRVSPVTVAELLLEWDIAGPSTSFPPRGIDAAPLTPELMDAAVRLARCLQSRSKAGYWDQESSVKSFTAYYAANTAMR